MRFLHIISGALEASFIRFCIIGAVGFLTDASILMMLIHGLGVSAIGARFVSFACAVYVTFELNRRWTFEQGGHRSYVTRLGAYLGVQSLGFACNMLIYTGVFYLLRPSPAAPMVALTIASVLALFVNYLGASTIVFGKKVPGVDIFKN